MPRSSPATGELIDIVVYPVKGLSGGALDRVQVTTRGIPFDRLLALAPSQEEAPDSSGQAVLTAVSAPTLETFSDLYSLDTHERLAGISTSVDPVSQRLTISVQGHVVAECSLKSTDGLAKGIAVLANVLDLDSPDQLRLVAAKPDFNFGWPGIEQTSHMWACHVVNLASVRDLESRIDHKVDPRRFRANLYVDLHEPWVERDWLDQRFSIGDVSFECVQASTRCATTEVNPATALRDLPLPRLLMQHYGHTELGFYATIANDGELTIGQDVVGPRSSQGSGLSDD